MSLRGASWVPSNADNEILLDVEVGGKGVTTVGKAYGASGLVVLSVRRG